MHKNSKLHVYLENNLVIKQYNKAETKPRLEDMEYLKEVSYADQCSKLHLDFHVV